LNLLPDTWVVVAFGDGCPAGETNGPDADCSSIFIFATGRNELRNRSISSLALTSFICTIGPGSFSCGQIRNVLFGSFQSIMLVIMGIPAFRISIVPACSIKAGSSGNRHKGNTYFPLWFSLRAHAPFVTAAQRRVK